MGAGALSGALAVTKIKVLGQVVGNAAISMGSYAISEGENAKGAVFKISESQDNGLKTAQSLTESIIFNLSDRLPKKTVNKESSDDHKYEVSERIKNGNKNPRANLFSRANKSLTPCQPLCIMLLKHDEREKTQDKQNYISY